MNEDFLVKGAPQKWLACIQGHARTCLGLGIHFSSGCVSFVYRAIIYFDSICDTHNTGQSTYIISFTIFSQQPHLGIVSSMYEGESRNLENLNDSKENPQDSNLELSDSRRFYSFFCSFLLANKCRRNKKLLRFKLGQHVTNMSSYSEDMGLQSYDCLAFSSISNSLIMKNLANKTETMLKMTRILKEDKHAMLSVIIPSRRRSSKILSLWYIFFFLEAWSTPVLCVNRLSLVMWQDPGMRSPNKPLHMSVTDIHCLGLCIAFQNSFVEIKTFPAYVCSSNSHLSMHAWWY